MISRLIPWWAHADLCQTKTPGEKNLNRRSWNQAGAPPIVLGAHHHLSSERSGFTTVCAFMLDYIRMSDISLGRINKCQIHSLQPESLPWMTGGSRVCICAAINSCLWIMQSQLKNGILFKWNVYNSLKVWFLKAVKVYAAKFRLSL